MTLRRRPVRRLGQVAAADDAAGDRWIVVDVESSGLDPGRDRLIAVAAVALHWTQAGTRAVPSIAIGDSFEAVLRQPEAGVDKQNILLHGIGVGAQRQGLDPRAALAAFKTWAAGVPLLAFHAPFDRRLLARAARASLGRALDNDWLDLAPLASVVLPDVRARSLDEWLDHFGLRCLVRHQAAADALVTAELFLQLCRVLQAPAGTRPGFRALQRLAAQRRWLP
jgi:DNA polymerase-3 subunit epsilon